jgi:hypothetical protein
MAYTKLKKSLLESMCTTNNDWWSEVKMIHNGLIQGDIFSPLFYSFAV